MGQSLQCCSAGREKEDACTAQKLLEKQAKLCRPTHPHTALTFPPLKGVGFSNSPTPLPFETDMARGSLLYLHRRSDDARLDRSGHYPYGDVFRDRKIFWECRVQLRFKRMPSGRLTFGLMLDEFAPLSGSAKYTMSLVVKALKCIVGDDVYHTTGDDPETTTDEVEKPIFAMPMLAFDQVIVTPDGEEVPDMRRADFNDLGLRRDRDGAAFRKLMTNFVPQLHATYTMSLWSIARFLDTSRWQISGIMPGVKLGMNTFCGRAPLHVVIYALKPAAEQEKKETRHVPSRIDMAMQCTVWSSEQLPPPQRYRELTQQEVPDDPCSTSRSARGGVEAEKPRVSRRLGCCSRRSGSYHRRLQGIALPLF